MVTEGPSEVKSAGISFPVVSFREIFAEVESMSWSKVAVSLSALVGIFIEPFPGDLPIVCGGSSTGAVVKLKITEPTLVLPLPLI